MKNKFLLILVLLLLVPSVSLAAGDYCGAGLSPNPGLCNPTAKFAGTLPALITNLLKLFGLFVGFQSILYVVFAGFKMVISQGDSEKLADAKNSLQWTLSGLILIIISFALVYAVSVFVGASDVDQNIGNINNTTINNPTVNKVFGDLTGRILTGFLGVAGVIALLMIIINGFRYMLSAGNDEQAENAKQGLQWAVIGLCLIALAYVIVAAVGQLFGSTANYN